MAVYIKFCCTSCQQTRETFGSPGQHITECGECKKKREEKELDASRDKRKLLTVEERLALLEDEMYELKKNPAAVSLLDKRY